MLPIYLFFLLIWKILRSLRSRTQSVESEIWEHNLRSVQSCRSHKKTKPTHPVRNLKTEILLFQKSSRTFRMPKSDASHFFFWGCTLKIVWQIPIIIYCEICARAEFKVCHVGKKINWIKCKDKWGSIPKRKRLMFLVNRVVWPLSFWRSSEQQAESFMRGHK